MARNLRVQFEGAIYHVTARGVEQRIIFDDDRDREHFVQRLKECVDACGVMTLSTLGTGVILELS